VMSRTQAAGKKRKVWVCPVHACPTVFSGPPGKERHVCPEHPHIPPRRELRTVKPGRVDYAAVRRRLSAQGIAVRGGGADEAPEVYKRLPDVLAAHGDTIRVKHTLRPLGVAMAGRDVQDPYKD